MMFDRSDEKFVQIQDSGGQKLIVYVPENMTMAVNNAYSALFTFMAYICRQKCNKSSIVSPMPATL